MLKRVRVVGFKSLADVTVELEPLTVLIGRSGTGKSNFVDALRFLRAFLATRDENVVEEFGGWSKVRCARPTDPGQILFQVVFDIPGIAELFEYKLGFRIEGKSVRFAFEDLQLGEESLFTYRVNQWVKPPNIDPLPELDGKPMLGAIAGVQEVAIAYFTLTAGLGCYDFPGTIFLDAPQRPNRFGLPQRLTGLSDHGENARQVLNSLFSSVAALSAWRKMQSVLKCIDPSVVSVTARSSDESASVSHTLGNGPFVLDLTQESAGFRRFLAHLLALHQVPGKSMLVFEEPEKGLHPGVLSALTDYFRNLTSFGRTQILVITHSPRLLDPFKPEEIRVAELHEDGTRIGPPASDQLEGLQERLLHPGELLTVDPARLVTPPVPVG